LPSAVAADARFSRGSWNKRANETVIAATIADLPQRLAAVAGPAVVMIGRVFARAARAGETNAPLVSQAGG
jgi:siroheme synthase